MTMRSLPFLLIACLALLFMIGEADAASPVSITTDRTHYDILEGETSVAATLTIENSDTEFNTQDIYLVHSWPSGISWDDGLHYFLDANYDGLDGNFVQLSRTNSTTIHIVISCDGSTNLCFAGDTNTVQIFAKTDPKFYNYDGNITDTCGSDDCETDTSPASASANVTNLISITFTARTGFASSIMCDVESSEGGNEVTSGNTVLWAYTLTNTGWNDDFYQFTVVVTSADGHNVSYWIVDPGMADGRGLAGHNASVNAEHAADGVITIVPATNATPGIYNVVLTVISNNGGQDSSCTFDVSVPENDTEERPTEEWTFYRDFVECDPDDNSLVTYNEFVDCLNTDLVNDGESMVNASSEFANEMFSMADLDMDGNLTSSEFDYIKKYPHESKEVVKDETEDESKEVVEDEEILEEIPEEVPSISLISSIAAIGIIALRRRY